MKMKKLISILAAGTMTMGLLAGCGSSSESTEEDTSGQAARKTVRMKAARTRPHRMRLRHPDPEMC